MKKIHCTSALFTVIIGLALATSCGQSKPKTENHETRPTYEKIKSISWLIGKWEMGNKDTLSTETWEVKNDSVFSARSMDIKAGKDTLRYEDITIEQRGNDLYYIPVVKGQNGNKPVLFKQTKQESAPVNGKEVIFENPDHDFPKKITYSLKGDTLFAEISGPIEGHEVTMRFPMVKAK